MLSRRGKVRDVYDLGEHLLIVATDRISAFDYVLGSGIPDKGRVLTQLSAFWFAQFSDLVPHHLLSVHLDDFPAEARRHAAVLDGRSMLVRKTMPLPIECVARGYLSGSGWKEYRQSGTVCGIPLRPGLQESARLDPPIFTPATKAETGHDENISEARAGEIVGGDVIARARDLTLAIYQRGAEYALTRGIIIADTKFEFGFRGSPHAADTPGTAEPRNLGTDLIVIDEILTPDSSRFWPVDQYMPGATPPSFDKQYVRDYLEQIGWNKQPPVPTLPDDVVMRTREKYLEAYRLLTGQEL